METLVTALLFAALTVLAAAVVGYGISLVEGVIHGRYKPKAQHRAPGRENTGS